MSFAWKKCSHEKIGTGAKFGYCPDCGQYVENHWYIARCKCCGIRQKTILQGNEPTSLNNFCKNCGCEDYIIEEIVTPDIVTINYATLKKVTQRISAQSLVQSWIERNIPQPYGFLTAT